MKTVFDTRMVAHIWAQQKQPHGRGGNLFFEGRTIYSYGKHFPIATFHTVKGKGTCVLFTTDGYSVSTTRHCSYVRRSIRPENPIFNVPKIMPAFEYGPDKTDSLYAHNKNWESYKQRIQEAHETMARSRSAHKIQWHAQKAMQIREEANRYAAFFGLPRRLKSPIVGKPFEKFMEEIRKKIKTMDAKNKKALAAKAKKQKETQEENIRLWRTGELSHMTIAPPNVLLRVNKTDVETSKGARVPVTEALRACRFVLNKKMAGETWHRNGERFPVGQFELDAIDADGNVRAGCHFIKWEEIARLLPALNL